MKQTIIGEIYSSLSKPELKKLNKFISYSHWSRSSTVVQCHKCLANYSSKGRLNDLDKSTLYKYTYEVSDYSDNKLRFTLNRLLEALKEFILLEANERRDVNSEKIWMDFIRDKRLKKNILYSIENKLEPQNTHDKFLYNYYKSTLNGQYNFSFKKDIDLRFNSLIDIVKNAEIFADFVFLRQYCLILTFGRIYKSSEFEIANTRYFEIKEKNWGEVLPEFDIYIALIDMLISNSIDDYHTYKTKFLNLISRCDEDDKVTLISYLINFSTAQINKGNVSFINEQYELYNFFEQQDIFKIKNYLNNNRINNVVHIYLRKKEFERAESFINKYVHVLKDDLIESCRHFNIARIRFENKRYKESLRELLQVDFGKDAFYSINSKVLLLKNYFELRETDALISLCTSFKEYLKKNKIISDTHRTSIMNFTKMVDKIYSTTSGKAEKIKDRIENSSPISEKNWLLEKIEEKIS